MARFAVAHLQPSCTMGASNGRSCRTLSVCKALHTIPLYISGFRALLRPLHQLHIREPRPLEALLARLTINAYGNDVCLPGIHPASDVRRHDLRSPRPGGRSQSRHFESCSNLPRPCEDDAVYLCGGAVYASNLCGPTNGFQ